MARLILDSGAVIALASGNVRARHISLLASGYPHVRVYGV